MEFSKVEVFYLPRLLQAKVSRKCIGLRDMALGAFVALILQHHKIFRHYMQQAIINLI